MKSTFRGAWLAAAAMGVGAGALWAHPGHVTEGGVWHTLTHVLGSPYHVAVVVGIVVVAVAFTAAWRPSRAVSGELEERTG